MKKVVVRTSSRMEMVDITDQAKDYVRREQVVDGLLLVYVPHTTAGVTINEGADPAVQQDIGAFLKGLIPQDSGFRHGEGNSDAHIKASLVGSSVSIIVEGGDLVLGAWQHIFFFEADGPRSRHVYFSHVSR